MYGDTDVMRKHSGRLREQGTEIRALADQLVVQAEAVISEDLDESLVWATRLAARYMGEDKAEAYGKRNAVPGELLVRGRITKVIAHANVAD